MLTSSCDYVFLLILLYFFVCNSGVYYTNDIIEIRGILYDIVTKVLRVRENRSTLWVLYTSWKNICCHLLHNVILHINGFSSVNFKYYRNLPNPFILLQF